MNYADLLSQRPFGEMGVGGMLQNPYTDLLRGLMRDMQEFRASGGERGPIPFQGPSGGQQAVSAPASRLFQDGAWSPLGAHLQRSQYMRTAAPRSSIVGSVV